MEDIGFLEKTGFEWKMSKNEWKKKTFSFSKNLKKFWSRNTRDFHSNPVSSKNYSSPRGDYWLFTKNWVWMETVKNEWKKKKGEKMNEEKNPLMSCPKEDLSPEIAIFTKSWFWRLFAFDKKIHLSRIFFRRTITIF